MPQLDQIIIFPQIFWLFLVFTTFYVILTHYFLPLFVKSIKLRKQVIELNTSESAKVLESLSRNQDLLQKSLFNELQSIKNIIDNNDFLYISLEQNLFLQAIDKKIGNMLYDSLLYCDEQVLESIFLECRVLNLNFKLN